MVKKFSESEVFNSLDTQNDETKEYVNNLITSKQSDKDKFFTLVGSLENHRYKEVFKEIIILKNKLSK